MRGDPPARGLQRDRRSRRTDRRRARDSPRRRHGLPYRLPADRQVDRRSRGRVLEASAPRARRQGAGSDLRRRRHGGGDGDDRRHRLLQRRAGLHRGDARARLEGRLRRRGQRPEQRSAGPGPRRHEVRGHHPRAAQLRAPARAGHGLPRAQAGQRRDRHRGDPARPARLLPRARRRRRPRAGRRDDPGRDLRPRDHRPAVQRRGEGDRVGQRDPLRPRLLGLDA